MFTSRGTIFLSAFLLTLVLASFCFGYTTRNIVLVVIDGARYTETLGDPAHRYADKMYNLSLQGSVLTTFANNNITLTDRAVPAIWCGAWTAPRDTVIGGKSTQYTIIPTMFEYYRKQLSAPGDSVWYVAKYFSSPWLFSYHPDYGPSYWATYWSQGSTDLNVWSYTSQIMDVYHPRFFEVYLAGVDAAGHSGNWTTYQTAISTADSIVDMLWQKIQTDPFYKDKTTMFVTNDHGRHTTDFTSHGDGCTGCRQIMFLAIGPDIKAGYTSSAYHSIPDICPTIGKLAGFTSEHSTGHSIDEIFVTVDTNVTFFDGNSVLTLFQNNPNPFKGSTDIAYELSRQGHLVLDVFDIEGRKLTTLLDEVKMPGRDALTWQGKDSSGRNLPSGIYILRMTLDGNSTSRKLVVLR
ncbi:MAG: T9SS type A sorting domain-containing protein [Candidatus Eisenbacteria bacterium]|nr:T9SS type A sorting domain-containing protein [Candidatus Eisenbacteria bacterium]